MIKTLYQNRKANTVVRGIIIASYTQFKNRTKKIKNERNQLLLQKINKTKLPKENQRVKIKRNKQELEDRGQQTSTKSSFTFRKKKKDIYLSINKKQPNIKTSKEFKQLLNRKNPHG